MTTPRIRAELSATPAEAEGVKYFDVSDPRSGVRMRLYDFEWLLASQMDGQRSLDEIARWASGSLQLEVTGASLREYATKLSDLGFFATDAAPGSFGATTETPLPPPTPGVDDEIPLDLSVDDAVTQQQEALPSRTAAPASNSTIDEPTIPRHDMNRRADAAGDGLEPELPAPAVAIESAPRKNVDDTPTQVNTLAAYRSPGSTGTGAIAPLDATSSTDRMSRSDLPAQPEKKKGGAGSIIGLFVVLLAIAGVVGYVKFYAPDSTKVTIQVVQSRDVARWHDGAGKIDKAPPRTMAFGEAGKVTDVVAAGTEVKAGTPLATLDSYTKVEKEVADVKDRLGFYQKQLEAATAKGNADAQKTAEGKVEEKRKLLGELEARAAKLRLVAPGPGVVDKVHVTAGGDAKSGETAVELTDKRLAATFKLAPAAIASMKVGDTVSLQAGADSKPSDGKIAKIDGDSVTVEVPEDAALKAGAEIHLVKSRLVNVVVVPASAVVKKGAVDTAFVLANGEVHAKTITVAERGTGEVYVSAGLTAGESIVTSGVDGLVDGQKATAQQ